MAKIELTAPDALPLVDHQQVGGAVKIKPEVVQNLNQQVEQFLQHLIDLPVHEKTFQDKVNAVHQLGHNSVKKSSRLSHRLLSRSLS